MCFRDRMSESHGNMSLVVRGSQGLCLQAPPDFTIHPGFSPDLSKSVKVFAWNQSGTSLAWSNMVTVSVANLDTNTGKWSTVHQIQQPKVEYHY